MQVKVEELSSVQRLVTVAIEAEQVDKTLDAIYGRLKKQAKLKGFRPGKAPRAILEKYYGSQAAGEAAEQIIGGAYADALTEADVAPVARPDFDFEAPRPGQDFEFKITVDVKPEFELKKEDYQGMELKEPDLKVTDELIDDRLEMLRDRQAITVPLDEERPAATGDVVVVDYTSYLDGEPLEGGSADNVEVELGKGQAQEEVELVLLKSKPGDMLETKVHYDEDASNPEVAGKDVTFKLLVKDVKQKKMPELDDDFARSVSPEFENLEALKDRIAKDTEASYQENRDRALQTQIMDNLRGLATFELPASLVQEEVEQMVESFKQRMRQQGMDPEAAGMDEAKLAEDFTEMAKSKVHGGIVLGKVADLEEVDVTSEDVDAHFEKLAESMGQPAQVLREMYNKNNLMSSLNAQLLEDKTLQAIKAGATITQVDPAELAPKPGEAPQA